MLKRLKKKDGVAEGYTLFLPWENYRPEVRQIKLEVTYINSKSEKQYGVPEVITLQSSPLPSIQQRREALVNYVEPVRK